MRENRRHSNSVIRNASAASALKEWHKRLGAAGRGLEPGGVRGQLQNVPPTPQAAECLDKPYPACYSTRY